MKKKLLFIMPGLYGGGAEKSLVNLLNIIDLSVYDIDLLLFRKEGTFLNQVPDEVHILDTPAGLKYSFSNPDKNVIRGAEAVKACIYRIIGTVFCRIFFKREQRKTKRWKLFYSHSIKDLAGSYDVALAYLHGESSYYVIDKVTAKKKILWVHNDYDKLVTDHNFERDYFAKADKVITISEGCVESLVKSFPDMKDKFMMLPNLTSSVVLKEMSDAFYPSDFYPAEFEEDTWKLLSVGRLATQKGFDMAIEAADMLRKKGIDFVWYVLGVGELKEELEKQIAKYGLEEQFILAGMKENPYPYMKNCDIIVQPSRFEGKSVVLDEAKILAKPIVVTNYPTVKDQIVDGKEGIIVDMNPEGIAEGIDRMIKDDTLRNKITGYLESHEYGNQDEVGDYIKLIDNDNPIIFVAPALRGGGAERVMVTLANEFCEYGCKIIFLLTLDDEIQYRLDENIDVVYNRANNSALGQIRFIRRGLKRYKEAVVISFFTYQNLYLLLAAFGLKNKIIVSERNDPAVTLHGILGKGGFSKLRIWLYATADHIVFQTEDAKNYFPKKVSERGVIIGNPLRTDLPEPYTGKRSKTLVAFSRLTRQKNIPMMLNAVKIVIEKHPEYILKIYGKGEEEENLKNIVTKLELQNNVFFMGFSNDVLNEIKDSVAFLSSSDYEGISNSMLESMAIGLPCICTDCPCGGTRTYIADHENGLLVTVGDEKGMASRIIELIENEKLQDKLSGNAVKIRETLSVNKIVNHWSRLMD